MIRKLSISVVLMLLVVVAKAQVTLCEYVESVIAHSYTLANAESVVDSSVAESEVARRGLLPELSLSSDVDMGFRSDRLGWGVRADVTQPIYNGGRYRGIAKQSESLVDVAESARDMCRLDVRYGAEVAYWSLSRAEVYREAMYDYMDIVRSLKDVALHRFEEGYTSKSDLLQVESRLSDAEYQLSQAEQSWLVALHNFNILRGATPTDTVVLQNHLFDALRMPKRVDVADFIYTHPQYHEAIAKQESARYGIKIREAAYLPAVDMGVFGLWQPKPLTGTELGGGVVVSLSVPIFHFGERRLAVSSARSSYRGAELAVDEIVDEITLNESNGWTNLQLTNRRVDATKRNLEVAQENLDISTYSYREGLATILDVLQAQLSWLQIYQNAISAQYDYAVAISAYRYIVAEF